jgi:hypothetical protein
MQALVKAVGIVIWLNYIGLIIASYAATMTWVGCSL